MWEDEAAAGSRSSADLGGRDPAPAPPAAKRRGTSPPEGNIVRKTSPDSSSAWNSPAPHSVEESDTPPMTNAKDPTTEAALQQLRDEILPEAESAVDEWKEKYVATKAALGFVENQYLVVIAERDALKRENERLRSQLEQRA